MQGLIQFIAGVIVGANFTLLVIGLLSANNTKETEEGKRDDTKI